MWFLNWMKASKFFSTPHSSGCNVSGAAYQMSWRGGLLGSWLSDCYFWLSPRVTVIPCHLLNLIRIGPFLKKLPKMTYPNLTACSSGPEAWICISLIPFERKHFEVGEMNVGEYNTLDLVKDNTKKKTWVFLFCCCCGSISFEMRLAFQQG